MTAGKIIVLGASGGIGSETARRLRDRGAELLLVGRTEERLAALSADLDSPFRVIDATAIDQVEACVGQGLELMGGVDGIVNCVGTLLLKPAHLTKPAEWHETIAVNLTSAFATIRGGYHAMRKSGGAIVLMSTAASRVGLPNHEAIAAAKAGILGLTKSAAASYASCGIRVNAVAPGLIKSPLTKRIWANEKSAEASRTMHALGRLGQPGDVASLIVWLLDPETTG